jgi:hypothetical protein
LFGQHLNSARPRHDSNFIKRPSKDDLFCAPALSFGVPFMQFIGRDFRAAQDHRSRNISGKSLAEQMVGGQNLL